MVSSTPEVTLMITGGTPCSLIVVFISLLDPISITPLVLGVTLDPTNNTIIPKTNLFHIKCDLCINACLP
jgi:hypothetical protein